MLGLEHAAHAARAEQFSDAVLFSDEVAFGDGKVLLAHSMASLPRHRWRDRIVPRPTVRRAESPACKADPPKLDREQTSAPLHKTASSHERGDGRAAFVLDAPALATASLTTTGAAEHVAPHVLSLAHWDRILDGELFVQRVGSHVGGYTSATRMARVG